MANTYFSEYGTGRCINCGFLAKRLAEGRGDFAYPVNRETRETGGTFLQVFSPESGQLFTARIACYRNQADLLAEVMRGADPVTTIPGGGRFREVVQKDRECPTWYPWTEFRSPREHLEELQMLELEKRREEFEQKTEKERREFELRLFEVSQDIQERRDTATKRTEGFLKKATWFFIVIGVAEVLAVAVAVLALVYPNGWPWLMGLLP